MKSTLLFLNLVVVLCSAEMALAETCPTIFYGNYNCVEQTTDTQTMIKIDKTTMPTTGNPAIQFEVEKIRDLKIPPQECLNKTQTVEYCTKVERDKDQKRAQECNKRFGANSFVVDSKHESNLGLYKVDSKMSLKSLATSQLEQSLDIGVILRRFDSDHIDLKVHLVDQKGVQDFHWECAY